MKEDYTLRQEGGHCNDTEEIASVALVPRDVGVFYCIKGIPCTHNRALLNRESSQLTLHR